MGFGPERRVKIESNSLANESLCLEEILLLRMVQDQLKGIGAPVRLAMGWELSETIFHARDAATSRTKLMLHKELAEEIRLFYLEDAQRMDILYFEGRNLFRAALDHAVDSAIPKPQSFDPSDYFDSETLRLVKFLTSKIGVLMANTTSPWQEYLLKRRVARLHRASDDINDAE
jgi:hypothetical protein